MRGVVIVRKGVIPTAFKEKKREIAYNNEYNRENYDRITIMMPKGTREKLKEIARERGESVNALVAALLKERYGV